MAEFASEGVHARKMLEIAVQIEPRELRMEFLEMVNSRDRVRVPFHNLYDFP